MEERGEVGLKIKGRIRSAGPRAVWCSVRPSSHWPVTPWHGPDRQPCETNCQCWDLRGERRKISPKPRLHKNFSISARHEKPYLCAMIFIFLCTFHIFMKQWGLKMLKTFKALLRPAAYQSYSQYHDVNTKLCIIQQRRDRSRVVWLNGSWQKYVSASFPGMTLFNQFFTSKFCTQIS